MTAIALLKFALQKQKFEVGTGLLLLPHDSDPNPMITIFITTSVLLILAPSSLHHWKVEILIYRSAQDFFARATLSHIATRMH